MNTEASLWEILNQDGIQKPDRYRNGPHMITLERSVIIIGKQWREACLAALEAKNISCSCTENQVIVPKWK